MKDLFMSGGTEALATAAAAICEGDLRLWLYRAIRFLLSHQFIRTPLDPGRLWKVTRGSGMGMVHSSSICDAALYTRAEKRFTLQMGNRRAHNIINYLRFRDDIWIAHNNPPLGRPFSRWCELFRRRCGETWKPEVVELSGEAVTMLAVRVFIDWSAGCLQFAVRDRVDIGPPLSV